MDRIWKVVIVVNIVVFVPFGYFIVSKMFYKPKIVVTDIIYLPEGDYQVFKGHVRNIGKADAYDVEVHVRWHDLGLSSYEDSAELGTIPPGGTMGFRVTFNVINAVITSHHHWVTFSSMPV